MPDTAPTPPAPKLDPETEKLKLEQVQAEARKAIAEADKATLAAQLPAASADVKPLEGKVDVGDKTGLVGRMVAYSLLGSAATEIAAAVKARAEGGKLAKARVLVLDDRNLIASDWAYQAIASQLAVEERALQRADAALAGASGDTPTDLDQPDRRFLGMAALPALGAAIPAVVSAAAGLAGMFRTDYAITGDAVTMESTPMLAAVAQELREGGAAVSVDAFECLDSPLVGRFAEAREKRIELEEKLVCLQAEKLTAAGKELDGRREELKSAAAALDKALGEKEAPAGLGDLKTRIGELRSGIEKGEEKLEPIRAAIAVATAAKERFDVFATAVATAPKEGAAPPLIAAALRERLHLAEDDTRSFTHVLFVKAEGAGQETITKRSLFGRSGQVGFMGGVQTSFLLLDVHSNRTVAAGSEAHLAHMKYDLGSGTAGKARRVEIEFSASS